jgi:hypothetical protein
MIRKNGHKNRGNGYYKVNAMKQERGVNERSWLCTKNKRPRDLR